MQAFQQMKQERQQRLQEEKKRTEERKKEEELRKHKEEKDQKNVATEAAAAAQVVSPSEAGQQARDEADPAINRNLTAMMQGDMGVETTEKERRDATESLIKNKQKKSYAGTAAAAPYSGSSSKDKKHYYKFW